MTNKLGPEVWYMIVEKVAEEDWKPLFISLPFVSRSVRIGTVRYLNIHVLPVLEKVKIIEKELPIVTKCQRLQMELERKIAISVRHWKKPIHMIIDKILRDVQDTENLQRFKDLLAARVDVNARTSQNQTPLLLVCDALGRLFSERFSPDDRETVYARVIELVDHLLQHGADPDLQGFPSTPLVTILSQQPFGTEDSLLMSKVLTLLVESGADPSYIPMDDSYGLKKRPVEMAKSKLCGFLLPRKEESPTTWVNKLH